ncbi:hypothetical protein Tco_0196642 [Tanacetum coccineum]
MFLAHAVCASVVSIVQAMMILDYLRCVASPVPYPGWAITLRMLIQPWQMSYLDQQKAEVVDRICRIKAGRKIEENVVINDLVQIGFRCALFDFPSSFMHNSALEQLCGYKSSDLRECVQVLHDLQLSRRVAAALVAFR